MNSRALLALQHVDTELDALEGERRRLPERTALAAATAQQQQWRGEQDRQRNALAAAEAEIAEAERLGAEMTTKQQRLETQLRTVSTTREADALQSEIDAIRHHHSDLDDRELAAMEAQSDAEAALVSLESQSDDITGTFEQASADLDRALERLAADEAALRQRRAAAEAELTEDERRLYEGLRARFGGVAICELDRRRCTGCHLDLSAAEADQVARAPADELPECPHCGRLIAR